MLDRLKAIFGDRKDESQASTGIDELQLAVATLLVEAAHLDSDFDAEERRTIGRHLANRFALDAEAAERLLDAATRASERTDQLYSLTRTVKDSFTHEERVELMQMLWEVVYADGYLHDYEANLMRRVSGLIYVTDRESGEARKRALERLGLKG